MPLIGVNTQKILSSFNFNLKNRRFAYVYSLYKELEGDGVKFETTNKNASLISYTIKLVEDSTYLMKTLVVSDVFLDNLTKIYDGKNIFVQNGNEWLILNLI